MASSSLYRLPLLLASIIVVVIAQVASTYQCMDGSVPVNCFVEPCDVYKGCSGQCLDDYCGGCNALCVCNSDADCAPGLEFCRPTSNRSISTCAAYSTEGSMCGGHVAYWAVMQCSPNLVCLNIEHPGIADLPGICHKPCQSQVDCSDGQLCLIDPLTNLSYCSDNRDIFYPSKNQPRRF